MHARFTLLLAIILPAILIISGCTREPAVQEPTETVLDGSCEKIFDGEICTYGVMNGDDLVEYGATIAFATVENAPMDEQPVFPPVNLARIAFPDEVRAAAGIDHLGINWEVQGHPPKTYMTPHFDFHFFMVDGSTVDAIDCSDATKPDVVPAGYVMPDFPVPDTDVTLVGMCVPQMGMHAMNSAESAAAETFDATMIIGYYSGDPIFMEPMVSHNLMMSREDFSLVLPDVSADSPVPSVFEATYDQDADRYTLKFRM